MQCPRGTQPWSHRYSHQAGLYQRKPVSPLVNVMASLRRALFAGKTDILELHDLGWGSCLTFNWPNLACTHSWTTTEILYCHAVSPGKLYDNERTIFEKEGRGESLRENQRQQGLESLWEIQRHSMLLAMWNTSEGLFYGIWHPTQDLEISNYQWSLLIDIIYRKNKFDPRITAYL